MSHIITESEVEEAALEILEGLGYEVVNGPDIAPDGTHPERRSYADVLLLGRLNDAVDQLNPKAPQEWSALFDVDLSGDIPPPHVPPSQSSSDSSSVP